MVLPIELQYAILVKCDYNTIIKYCLCNRSTLNFCKDQHLWQQKACYDFSIDRQSFSRINVPDNDPMLKYIYLWSKFENSVLNKFMLSSGYAQNIKVISFIRDIGGKIELSLKTSKDPVDIVQTIHKKRPFTTYELERIINTSSDIGNIKLCEFSIECGCNNLNTSLIQASHKGFLDIVIFLIKKGANDLHRAVSYASMGGHLDVIKYIYENNNLMDLTHVLRLVSGPHPNLFIVEYITQSNKNININDCFIQSINNKHYDIIRYFLKLHPSNIYQGLEKSVYTGDLNIFKLLFNYCVNKNINVSNIIEISITQNRSKIICFLIDNNFKLSHQNILYLYNNKNKNVIDKYLTEHDNDKFSSSNISEALCCPISYAIIKNAIDINVFIKEVFTTASGCDKIYDNIGLIMMIIKYCHNIHKNLIISSVLKYDNLKGYSHHSNTKPQLNIYKKSLIYGLINNSFNNNNFDVAITIILYLQENNLLQFFIDIIEDISIKKLTKNNPSLANYFINLIIHNQNKNYKDILENLLYKSLIENHTDTISYFIQNLGYNADDLLIKCAKNNIVESAKYLIEFENAQKIYECIDISINKNYHELTEYLLQINNDDCEDFDYDYLDDI